MKKIEAGLGSVTELAPKELGGAPRFWARGPRPRRTSLGVFATFDEADEVRAAAAVALATSDRTRVVGVTLRAFGERHLEERELDGGPSCAPRATRWKHIAKTPFIDDPIETIPSKHVLAWVKELRKKKVKRGRGPGAKLRKISRNHVRGIVGQLSQIFAAAVAEGLAGSNPAAGIIIRSVKDPDEAEVWTYLDADEQRSLLTCLGASEAVRLMMAFAIGTGLRQGEQFNLELRDLHVDGPTPYVFVRWGSKGRKPKNGKERPVPLFGLALAAAKRWLELLPTFAPKNPHKLVFPLPTGTRRRPGQHLQHGSGNKVNDFRNALKAAGIVRHVRWHDLRHTCASSLVAGWWGPTWRLEDIKEVLGHTSIRITERYAHIAPAVVTDLAARTGLRVGYSLNEPTVALLGNSSARGASVTDPLNASYCSTESVAISASWSSSNPAVTRASIDGLRALARGDARGALRLAGPIAAGVLADPIVRAALAVQTGGEHVEARLAELFEAVLASADQVGEGKAAS